MILMDLKKRRSNVVLVGLACLSLVPPALFFLTVDPQQLLRTIPDDLPIVVNAAVLVTWIFGARALLLGARSRLKK